MISVHLFFYWLSKGFDGIVHDCFTSFVLFPALQELRECEGKVFVDAEPEFVVPEVGH